MTWTTHLVEWLDKINVHPEALVKDYLISPNYIFYSKYSLIYNTNDYFASEYFPNNILTIDLKKTVLIEGYQIKAGVGINWILNWNFSVYRNGRWKVVDIHDKDVPPGDTIYHFPEAYNTRYIRLNGGINANGNSIMSLYYIKFYGLTVRSNTYHTSCRSKSISINMLFVQLLCSWS